MSEEKQLSEEERQLVLQSSLLTRCNEMVEELFEFVESASDLAAPNGAVDPRVILLMARAVMEKHPSLPLPFWVTLSLVMICHANRWTVPTATVERAWEEMTPEERERFKQFCRERRKQNE